MAVSIHCPACDKKLICSAPPVAGQQMRCHGCGHSFLVPEGAKPEPLAAAPPTAKEVRPSRAPLVASVAVVALVLIAVATYLLTRDPASQTVSVIDPPVPADKAEGIDNSDHQKALAPPRVEDLSIPDLDHPHLSPLAPLAPVKLSPADAEPKPDPVLTPPDKAPPDKAPPDKAPPDKAPPDKAPPDKTPPDKTPPDKTPPVEPEFKQLQARLAWDEAELMSQLAKLPELDVSGVGDVRFAMHNNKPAVDSLATGIVNPQLMMSVRAINNTVLKLLKDEQAQGLPVRSRSMLSPLEAVSLKTLSADVRTTLPANVAPGSARFIGPSGPGRAKAMDNLFQTWSSRNLEKNLDIVPTVVQMLQIEDADVRGLLVQELDRIKHPGASMALASRAAFDASPEVRKAAIEALRSRKPEEYRVMLLYAMRYPWPPAADHAAEALIALKDTGAVPGLIKLLKTPDPARPTLSLKTKKYVIPEVVRINHLRNCYLCHAPSFSTNDPVRGAVPVPGQALPSQYYAGSAVVGGEGFVRADVSYLREDFSISLAVKDADPWPPTQRYDYLVRMREPGKDELRKLGVDPNDKTTETSDKLYPQQEAVLFALTRLTGKNFGTDAERWKSYLADSKAAPKK